MIFTNPTQFSSILITSTGIGAIIISYHLYNILQKKKKMSCNNNSATNVDDQGRKLGRTMSFTSAAMVMGAMPVKSKNPLPTIHATLLFENQVECPTPEALVETGTIEKMLAYERFGGIPVRANGNNWKFRACLNVDPLKMTRILDIEGNNDKLYKVIEEHLFDDLRENRGDIPWWEFLIIRNYGSGLSACVLRCDHSLSDGLSLVTLFQDLITNTDGSKVDDIIPSSMKNKFDLNKNKTSKRPSSTSMFFKSFNAFYQVVTLAKTKFDDAVVFRKSIQKGFVFNGNRKIVIFQTLSLPFIKDLKNKANVTINDILFTALSQAIRDYCLSQNCPLFEKSKSSKKKKKIQFRALMPVALPRTDKETQDKTRALRNKWVFVSSDMGIGLETLSERLAYINKQMNKIKYSPLALMQWKVQESLVPKLPLSIGQQTVYDTFVRHSMVYSNVPGPSHACLLAGKFKAVGVQMIFANMIPQVGILSYNDQVFMNMVLDPSEVVNCDSLPFFMSRALVSLGEDFGVDIPLHIKENAERCPSA